MHKIISGVFAGLISTALWAQDLKNPNLQSLINTERAFAKLATDKSTKTAFLTYLADSSVTFGGGRPQNGRKQYEGMKENESLLTWEPIYSDISASGDFGFNTGPWQFRSNKTDAQPALYGDFVSVWQKDTGGNWKLYLDLGVRHPAPVYEKPAISTSSIILKKGITKNEGEIKSAFLDMENKFLASFHSSGTSAYSSLISKEARFFRTGKMPVLSSANIQQLLDEQNKTMTVSYSVIDVFVAPSGDVGTVYGTVTVKYINSTDTTTHTACYQRIWKKEDGKNWKIVIDVIGVN